MAPLESDACDEKILECAERVESVETADAVAAVDIDATSLSESECVDLRFRRRFRISSRARFANSGGAFTNSLASRSSGTGASSAPFRLLKSAGSACLVDVGGGGSTNIAY